MVTVSQFSNFPDELSENDELREFELSRSDCTETVIKGSVCFWLICNCFTSDFAGNIPVDNSSLKFISALNNDP